MYNVQRINDWKKKVQSEIDGLIEKHKAELNQIVKEEIPENISLYCRMGTCVIEENGEPIYDDGEIEEFAQEIANLSYSDAFETNALVDEINVTD